MELNIPLLITVGLITLTLIIGIVLYLNSRPKHKQVYLVGLAGSGKTKLFYKIISKDNAVSTLTSQVRNEFTIVDQNGSLNLVDLPGHPRIRTEVINAIKTADAIIFTIDSETVMKVIGDIANFVYEIISNPEVIKRKIPIMFLTTKTDIQGSRDVELVQQELEIEIDYIRDNLLKSNYIDDAESEQIFLGEEGKEFRFDQLVNPITFGSSSVKSENTEDLTEFLAQIMKK